MAANETPAVVLGLDINGQAFERANAALDKQGVGWEKIEGHVARIGSHVDGLLGRVAALAGVAGVGLLANDFLKLEDAAVRASLAVGSITGNTAGYRPLRDAVRSAAIATGNDPAQMLQSIANLQGAVGGTYLLGNPTNQNRVAAAIGGFATAFGLDPRLVATQTGAIEANTRVGTGATGLTLSRLAGQAAGAGMAFQTGLFTQTVAGMTSALGQSAPGQAGPLTALTVGALYGTAASQNTVFRDPGVFGQGLLGIQSSVQNAYQNPRLQAAMQMAGIGYWEQRGGFNGPHGRDLARKLLTYSNKMYGSGTEEQDLFLRSNFGGTVSADLLKTLASGNKTYEQLLHPDDAAARRDIQMRDSQFLSSPATKLEQMRRKALRDTTPVLDPGSDFLTGLPWWAVAAGGAGGGALLTKGVRGIARKLIKNPRDAARAASITEDAVRAGSSAEATASAADHVAAVASAHAAGEAGAMAIGHAGPLAMGAMFGLDFFSRKGSFANKLGWALDDTFAFGMFHDNKPVPIHGVNGYDPRVRQRHSPYDVGVNRSSPMGPIGGGAVNVDPRLQGYPDGGASTAMDRPNSPTDRFGKAVDRFGKAVDTMKGHPGGRQGVDYALGMNAAGTSNFNDQIGSSMLFARYLTGGGGSGGSNGDQFAAWTGGNGGGGGGGGGGAAGGTAAQIRARYSHAWKASHTGHPNSNVLNRHQIRQIVEAAGGTPAEAAVLASFALDSNGASAESGGDPGISNDQTVQGHHATGLFQLIPQTWSHSSKAYKLWKRLGGTMATLRNPVYNAMIALALKRDRGGWGDWAPHTVPSTAGVHSALGGRHTTHPHNPAAHPHALARWVGAGSPAALPGGGGGDLVINIDGRVVARHQQLTRGAV